jgi:galactosyl transferase GMA12/MNN10 family
VKALCSIGSGPHEALLEISRPTFAAFAERHGYELITSPETVAARPPAWAKVPMVREALGTYDLVLWIDADAVIVDGSRDIADGFEANRFLALVRHGERQVPNTGVMVDRVWAAKRFVHHPWWENAALLDALGYDLPGELEPSRLRRLMARRRRFGLARPAASLAGVQFLPLEWNSVYLDRADSPRIVHCVGVPVSQRARDMSAALDRRTAAG